MPRNLWTRWNTKDSSRTFHVIDRMAIQDHECRDETLDLVQAQHKSAEIVFDCYGTQTMLLL